LFCNEGMLGDLHSDLEARFHFSSDGRSEGKGISGGEGMVGVNGKSNEGKRTPVEWYGTLTPHVASMGEIRGHEKL
jgi:hypothetical protein